MDLDLHADIAAPDRVELTRLYPDPNDWARKVVIRKGRENYLCLLNLEEALGQLAAATPRHRAGADGALGGDE